MDTRNLERLTCRMIRLAPVRLQMKMIGQMSFLVDTIPVAKKRKMTASRVSANPATLRLRSRSGSRNLCGELNARQPEEHTE